MVAPITTLGFQPRQVTVNKLTGADRQAGMQTDRQADRQAGRQTSMKAGRTAVIHS